MALVAVGLPHPAAATAARSPALRIAYRPEIRDRAETESLRIADDSLTMYTARSGQRNMNNPPLL